MLNAEGRFRSAQSFIKSPEYLPSKFEIRYSVFDILRFSLFSPLRLSAFAREFSFLFLLDLLLLSKDKFDSPTAAVVKFNLS
jgi:hypothetical protein